MTTAAQIGPEAVGIRTLCPVETVMPNQTPLTPQSTNAIKPVMAVIGTERFEPNEVNAAAVATKAKMPISPIIK